MTVTDVAAKEENTSTNIIQQVVKICNDQLGCEVKLENILLAYVIQIRRNTTPDTPRLVVARFTRHVIQDKVYAMRSYLAGYNRTAASKIYMNEDLTNSSQKLASELRKMIKEKHLLSTWSKNNKLFVKKLDGSVKSVSSINDVY